MAKAKKKGKKKAAKKKAVKKKAAKPKKKTVVKKKAPAKSKKKVFVKISSNILGEAPQEMEFYLSDGRRLKSVFELVDALEHMSEDMFKEHVNEMKNDFSSWMKDVFKEPNVAKEMKKIQDRIETQKVLMKKLIDAAKKARK
jgi:hypothetical protein